MKRTTKGFTLTELLVTIAILAVIATVSIVGYTSFINRANDSNAATELEQIQAYIEADLMVDNKWEFQDKDGNRYLVTRNNKKLTAFNVVGDEYQPAKLGDVISKCPDFKDLGTITVDDAGVITYTRANGKGTATWEGMTAQPDSEIGGNANPDEPVCAHEGGEATCVDQAICTLCGAPYGDLAANNHNIVTDAAVEATCTTTGLTEGSHCTRCNNATVAQDVVPVNDNHSLTNVAEVPATCTTPGTAAGQRCTREGCNYTTGMGELPVTEHDWVDTDLSSYKECSECHTRGVVSGGYTLVTDASTLVAGDKIVIVGVKETGKYYALGTTQNSNNRDAVEVMVNGDVASIGDNVQVITLEVKANGTFAFHVDGDSTGYLYAAGGTSSNYIRTKAEYDTTCDWTITISGDGTTIKANDTNISRNTLMLNTQSALFACYSGGQTPVSVYKFVEGEITPVETHTCNQDVVISGYEAKCEVAGLTDGARCSDCGKITLEQSETTALVHNFVDHDNDCTTPKECDRTDCRETDNIILEHNFVDGECTNEGCNATKTETTGTWQKATSITVGDKIVLVYEAGKMELSGISTTSTKYGQGSSYTDTPAGTMVLEVVAGSTSGTYAFKTSDNKYLYWGSGNSLNVNATLDANTSWIVEFDADENATIKNAKDNTRVIYWNTGSPRFACYTSSDQKQICIYKLEGGTGSESGSGSEEITTSTKTYTFSDYTAGTQYAENEEHVLDSNTTVKTTQCHFTTELRIYSSSAHDGYAIIQSTKAVSALSMNAGNKKDTIVIYGSNDAGATWTEVGRITTTSTNYNDYSATLSASYKWLKLDVAGSEQVRVKNITLTVEE